MIKNIIVYSFILFAGIILVAHDIVPHHHHSTDSIGQSLTFSDNADKEHHHSIPEHEHQYEDYIFFIRQTSVLSPGLCKNIDSDEDYPENNGSDFFFVRPPFLLYLFYPPDSKIPIEKNTRNINTTLSYTFGLRAPPAMV